VNTGTPKLFWGPFGTPRMRENRAWSPADVGTFMAQVRPSSCLTLGAAFEGLRIVATSTRVRLFIFPAGSRG
jgi:hypothetical protein